MEIEKEFFQPLQFERIGELELVCEVPDADAINHIVVFMTGAEPFPDGFGGSGWFLFQKFEKKNLSFKFLDPKVYDFIILFGKIIFIVKYQLRNATSLEGKHLRRFKIIIIRRICFSLRPLADPVWWRELALFGLHRQRQTERHFQSCTGSKLNIFILQIFYFF